MTTISDHARSIVAYTRWADDRILDAASRLAPDDFAPLAPQLAHMTGTIRWWHARWTGGQFEEPRVESFEDARSVLTAAHDAFEAFAATLDDPGWNHAARWWKDFGYDMAAPAGEMLAQVVLHGVQHRSEIAAALTALGQSPGNLDYLFFLAARAGVELR
jgi:uncharacterized damage-inducible protein DinB